MHPLLTLTAPESARRYNVSYVYHSLYAYFSRDNVALPGIAAFFKKVGQGRDGQGCSHGGGSGDERSCFAVRQQLTEHRCSRR